VITCNNITKAYGAYTALRDLSLHIPKGELAFVTGQSGAGKTTLLKLVYLAERPDEGSIVVGTFTSASIREGHIPHLRRQIGVVFQDFRLLPNKTVFDNIALALRIRGAAEQEIKDRVMAALKLVNLRHKTDSYPLTLSGGEQQRITIARAVVGDPTVLLADEPTGNLDDLNARNVMSIFREVNAKGTTILIATHNHALFRGTGLRVLTLVEGELAREEKG